MSAATAYRFKPGMTFTNEPGIYIREDALNYLPDTPGMEGVHRKGHARVRKIQKHRRPHRGRYADHDTGVDWMTKSLPRKIDDIEAFMAHKLRRTVRLSDQQGVQNDNNSFSCLAQ